MSIVYRIGEKQSGKTRRQRNVIIFNLPESCANSTAKELKEDCKDIKMLITELMEMTS